jgi:hypothetical protein
MDLTYTQIANGEITVTAVSDNAKKWLADKLGPAAVSFTIPIENLQQVLTSANEASLIFRLA